MNKDAESEQIAQSVRIVAEGGSYVSPTLASLRLQLDRKEPTLTPGSAREVLELARGVLGRDVDGEVDVDARPQHWPEPARVTVGG